MDYNNQDLNTNTFAGEIENNPKGMNKAIKKMFKKQIDWYIFPWGQRQNSLNHEFLKRIIELTEQLKMYSERNSSQEETIRILSDRTLLLEEKARILEENTNYLENSLKNTQNDYLACKQELSRLCEFFSSGYEGNVTADKMLLKMNDLSQENLNDGNEQLINGICDNYEKTISEENDNKETIVIICENFKENRNIEAVRTEAYNIFNSIAKSGVYNALLISMEKGNEIHKDNDIVYVGDEILVDYLQNMNVKLVFWNCPVLSYAYCARTITLKYLTIMRLTSQNPLQTETGEMDGKTLELLLHQNDHGFLKLYALSEYAKDKLEQTGFKNVALSNPKIVNNFVLKKGKTGSQKVIGFASSPMCENQYNDRGVLLLSEVINKNPDYTFKILWRNKDAAVPNEILEAKNADIAYGPYDMETFYNEIDCMLIPYTSDRNNHACSLSGIEAMLLNIPVIATSISGVSDWVNKTGLGIVADANSASVTNAIKEVFSDYMLFSQSSRCDELINSIKDDRLVYETEWFIENQYVPAPIITLGDWEKDVNDHGNELVIGRENIKKYYSQFKVAEHYTEQRFTNVRDKLFDRFERASIDLLIRNKAQDKQVKILDIAPGDGRILQEDIKFGECVAMDASAAMLNLVKERFNGAENLHTVEGDYFVDEIDDKFDVITTFRYIRHFAYKERKQLYAKIKRNLKQDGVLIFDVPNIKFEFETRLKNGWYHYNIYDVFWNKDSIIKELDDNGFRVYRLIEVGKGLTLGSEDAMTWTVAAIKKD